MNRFNILLGKKSEKEDNSFLRWKKSLDLTGPELYRQELLGESPEPKCSVSGSDGSRCPNKPKYFLRIMGKGVSLCERCYDSYRKSNYNPRWQKGYNNQF